MEKGVEVPEGGRGDWRLTLSQSLMPFESAVSASIKLSVSSYKIEAYRSRILASCRGVRRLLCRVLSRHESPVAMSF